MSLVKGGQVARASSAQSSNEEQENHHEDGSHQQKGVEVYIRVGSFDPFQHVRCSITVIVHVLSQPAGEAFRTVQVIGLGIAIGVNLGTWIERERVLCIAETVVVIVFIVDVRTSGFSGVGVEPSR